MLGNLGNVHENLGDPTRAEKYYQDALAIHREIRNKLGEAGDLNNLGNVYVNLDDYTRAEKYCQDALRIFKELKIPDRVKRVKNNLERIKGKD